ncbi:MAG: ROK family protein [Pseudomonadota bacterium]
MAPNRPGSETVLAADVGGSFIRLAAVALPSCEIERTVERKTPTDDAGTFLASVAEATAHVSGVERPKAPLAIAIAGTIHPRSRSVTSANIPCLNGVDLEHALAERLDRPVMVLNDANAFALAEASIGVGRGHAIVFGAVLGTGIGGGLIIDGRVIDGAWGIAGEWGHGPIANQQPASLDRPLPRLPCGCGQTGCVDTFGGARGLERLHRALGHPPASSHEIVSGWKSTQPDCTQTVTVWAEMVSEPLTLAINVTGASVVPTGGGLGSDPDLMALLDREVRARIPHPTTGPVVVPGPLKGDAGLIGAALLGRTVLQATE